MVSPDPDHVLRSRMPAEDVYFSCRLNEFFDSRLCSPVSAHPGGPLGRRTGEDGFARCIMDSTSGIVETTEAAAAFVEPA